MFALIPTLSVQFGFKVQKKKIKPEEDCLDRPVRYYL